MKKRDYFNSLAIYMLIGMTILLVIQVISRYIFGKPIEWSEEMARFLFVWLGFTAAATALQYDQHVGFTFIRDNLPIKYKQIVDRVNTFLRIIFLIILIVFGIRLAINAHSIPSVTLSFIRWSYVYASLPVGLSMMLIIEVIKIKNGKDGKDDKDENMNINI